MGGGGGYKELFNSLGKTYLWTKIDFCWFKSPPPSGARILVLLQFPNIDQIRAQIHTYLTVLYYHFPKLIYSFFIHVIIYFFFSG
jgi:hypothetical protein